MFTLSHPPILMPSPFLEVLFSKTFIFFSFAWRLRWGFVPVSRMLANTSGSPGVIRGWFWGTAQLSKWWRSPGWIRELWLELICSLKVWCLKFKTHVYPCSLSGLSLDFRHSLKRHHAESRPLHWGAISINVQQCLSSYITYSLNSRDKVKLVREQESHQSIYQVHLVSTETKWGQ